MKKIIYQMLTGCYIVAAFVPVSYTHLTLPTN